MAKIIIPTDMDNSGFEKKYKKLKDKIEKEELKLEVKQTNLDDANEKLREANQELEKQLNIRKELRKEIKSAETQYNALVERFNSGEQLSAGEQNRMQFLEYKLKDLDAEHEKINQKVNKYNDKVNNATDKVVEAENALKQQEKTVANVRQEYAELVELQQQKQLEQAQARLDGIKNQINGIGKQMTNTVKKVGRWALAIFGVRSAYMFVRNAINLITQEDEQLKYDIQLIKTALAYSIEPIVRRIVEIAKTLIGYLAYIIRAWSGRDIFAKASEHLASASASAKELQKTSASFDKFNKLSSSKGTGGGGGASTKLNIPTDQEMKGTWIGWIAKNGKKVKAILMGIAGAVLAVQLGLGLLPAVIVGVITAIIAYLVSKYDDIIEGFNRLLAWLKGPFKDKVKKDWGLVGALFVDIIAGAVAGIKGLFEGLIGGIKKIAEGILDIFKGDFKTGLKKIFSGIADIILAPFKAIYNAVDTVIGQIFEALGLVEQLEGYSFLGGGTGAYGGRGKGGARAHGGIYYPELPKLALGGIVNMPGRGVAYHGATIGERGAEAVVPLTDTAQMERLGATIGKYVSVNADITLELESRVLAKVMKEISNNNQFMRNGG